MSNDPNDLPNLDILIKCMKMTTHENDNQALVAIRAANKQLLKFGGDWDTLLRGKVKIIADPFSGMTMPPAAQARGGTHYPAPPRRPTPTPPPRPQYQQYSPPPPPPSQWPKNGDIRTNRTSGPCSKCQKPVAAYNGREVYHALLGIWICEHLSRQCPQPPRRDNEKTNSYAGTCRICSKRVEAHTGTVYHDGSKWRTEHLKGQCPQPGTTRRKQPLTSDDLMS